MKHTAEEVRDYADACRLAHKGPVIADMLTELAERIEADEMAADYPECSGDPASCPENEGFGCCKAHAETITLHPPAQAAQVDQVGELLAIIHGDRGHYQAEHGLQKAVKDAQEKVIQMMTKIATAEPVAQGEAAKTAAMDFETWLREVDALYDKHLAKHDGRYIAASTHLRHEGWRAALEAIDLAAVRRAVDQLREACRTSNDSAHGTLSTSFVGTYLDDIEAAIKGES